MSQLLDRAFEAHQANSQNSVLQQFAHEVQQALQIRQILVLQFVTDNADDFDTLYAQESLLSKLIPQLIDGSQGGSSSFALKCSDTDGQEAHIQATVSSLSELQSICFAWTEGADDRIDTAASEVVDLLADLRRRELVEVHSRESHRLQVMDKLESNLSKAKLPDDIFQILCCDLPPLLQADCVAIGQRSRSSKWRIRCTTGVAVPNDRSEAVTKLVASISSAEYSQEDQTSESFHAQEQCRVVEPVSFEGTWLTARNVLVVDFSDPAKADSTLIRRIGKSVVAALSHVRTLESDTTGQSIIPRFLRSWGGIALLVLAIVAMLLTLVDAEFSIPASGMLVPRNRQHVFAKESGIVEFFEGQDGANVNEGEVLCRLRNEDLMAEQERIQGDLAAHSARLATIESLRGTEGKFSPSLAAEQAELRIRIDSDREQLALIRSRIALLTIQSEMTGQIYGTDLQEKLQRRPIGRGQHLFDVADPKGEWEIVLEVDETDIQYLVGAWEVQPNDILIRYSSELRRTQVYEAKLGRIATGAMLMPDGQIKTRVMSTLPSAPFEGTRPWSGINARISCGRRSLGTVLFYRFFDTVRRYILLRF